MLLQLLDPEELSKNVLEHRSPNGTVTLTNGASLQVIAKKTLA